MTGNELRAKRKSSGWTQAELAQKLGVSKGTIINYEKGRTIPESKTKILAAVFDLKEEREYKVEHLLSLLSPDLRSSAKKVHNPARYVLELVLGHIDPELLVSHIDKNRDIFFQMDEFRLLSKNAVGMDEIEMLKIEIKTIKQKLDGLTKEN